MLRLCFIAYVSLQLLIINLLEDALYTFGNLKCSTRLHFVICIIHTSFLYTCSGYEMRLAVQITLLSTDLNPSLNLNGSGYKSKHRRTFLHSHIVFHDFRMFYLFCETVLHRALTHLNMEICRMWPHLYLGCGLFSIIKWIVPVLDSDWLSHDQSCYKLLY